MKHAFAAILAGLIGLSGLVWTLTPARAKSELVWCSDNNPTRRGQMDLFNRLHEDYHVRLDPDNTDMSKVIVQSIAGVGPDLFDSYNGFQTSAYVRAGIAWDITDELAEAGIDVARDTWPAAHTMSIYDARTYGFPRNAGTDALYFNKKIFDARGEPHPPAYIRAPEFLRTAKRLTVKGKHFGFIFSWWQWQHFLSQWGGQVYSPDGTRCLLDSDEAIAAVQFMHELVYKYKVSPTPDQESAMATTGGWGSGPITLFGGGRAAMALGGRWWLCTLRKKDQFPNLSHGVTECQFGPIRRYRGYCGSVLINKKSPRRRQALQFLIYMYSQAYNELINHQADALGPVKKYAFTDKFLQDSDYPEETYNHVWRKVMEYGVPEQVSPFVNGNAINRIITRQLDLVKADLKPPANAMRTAAEQVNEEIRKTLERDPTLRAEFERLTGREVGT